MTVNASGSIAVSQRNSFGKLLVEGGAVTVATLEVGSFKGAPGGTVTVTGGAPLFAGGPALLAGEVSGGADTVNLSASGAAMSVTASPRPG